MLEWFNENILKDSDSSMYYLKLPLQLTWIKFQELTQSVKNNFDNSNFDVVLVVIYASRVHDIVRIYSKNIIPEQLDEIRKKYLEGIHRTEESINYSV